MTEQAQLKSTRGNVKIKRSLPADSQAESTQGYAASATPLHTPELVFTAQNGKIYCGDSLQVLNNPNLVRPGSVNLIMTSPPFGLVRQKEYGNVDADEYLE